MRVKRALTAGLIGVVALQLAQRERGPRLPSKRTPPTVLVTYDLAAKAKLPREQRALLDSVTFRKWLTDHCAKSSAGVPAWRIVAAGTEFHDDEPEFKTLSAKERASPNWMYVAAGEVVKASVPLPESEAAAVKLIAKFAPP